MDTSAVEVDAFHQCILFTISELTYLDPRPFRTKGIAFVKLRLQEADGLTITQLIRP
jgi:hypothetical protein